MFGVRLLMAAIARAREIDRLRNLDDRMLDDIGISRREAMLGRPIGRPACALGPLCPHCCGREHALKQRNDQNARNEYAFHS